MTVQITPDDLQRLEDILLNASGSVPLHKRFRALFTLKALGNDNAIQTISKGFSDSSALLKHELAYCLGQMKQTAALPVLESVLRNMSEDPMVRHEAAEAMGAISALDSMPVLKEFLSDSERSVRETCEIAIARIEWENSEEGRRHSESHVPYDGVGRRYTSIDPAPATSSLLRGAPKPDDDVSPSNINALREQLIDKSLHLFERYRAMFALRNIGTPAAVDALAAGFSDDSALFKHEIAFVFGQMLSPQSVPSLLKILQSPNESGMVRHEAAEALGGIGTPEVLPHLMEWMAREDAPRVVRESCQVAIDMWEMGLELQSWELDRELVVIAFCFWTLPMPLDGHSFLVAQGWAGKGTGLREGAISRPLAIPQKRTLAGVGKDRDEAFPFWDHLFSAAAKSIQLKIHNSDSEEDEEQSDAVATPVLSRTSTGILSNRRPVTDASTGTSGTSTPVENDSKPGYSLLVMAKREAARRNLYSRFFRGPVLGPDTQDGIASMGIEQKQEGSRRKKKKVKEEGGVGNSAKKTRRQDEGRDNGNERKKTKRRHKTDVSEDDASKNIDEKRTQHALTLHNDDGDRKQRKGKDKKEVELKSDTLSPTMDHRKKRRRKE